MVQPVAMTETLTALHFDSALGPGNMVLASICPQVQDLFEAQGNDRLKLLVLYSGEDDELLRRAAAGGLAMLTSMRPSLCSRIPQVVSACSWQGRMRG